jgi:uncharacterized OB-fold protein
MAVAEDVARDWTAGEPAITFQTCPECRAVWYLRRGFCPRCGNAHPSTATASGRGTVAACTVVTRAPSAELRPYAPYGIVLVDASEGFRLMAQGDRTLAIGDRVTARFVSFGDRLIPHFERET